MSSAVRKFYNSHTDPLTIIAINNDVLTRGTSTHMGCFSEYNSHHSKYISFSGHKTRFHLAKPGDYNIYLYNRGLGAI